MFKKLFSFLGFNSSQSLVGLAQLGDTELKPAPQKVQNASNKEMKLSDLMRGM